MPQSWQRTLGFDASPMSAKISVVREYVYRLHDIEGDDLGELLHPAPNLEPGDEVTTEDGRNWRVTRAVETGEGAAVQRLLEVEKIDQQPA